ncbi:hypothetical protein CSH63_21550 [Micromonospora tulbaghiae]|uniref:Uncharacterized protein n=1 Tax=Micromonospora tulbaghiae TaxID=479978 RepID=A0A386WPA8_9ACTN|nr:hypothetical protein CSH63_21550 [Micromonospora tulbaghiae]
MVGSDDGDGVEPAAVGMDSRVHGSVVESPHGVQADGCGGEWSGDRVGEVEAVERAGDTPVAARVGGEHRCH